MKHIFTTASFAALGVAGLYAGSPFDTPLNRSYYAPAPELTQTQLAKPWSVSATLRGFYDDNYTTAPSGFEKHSYGFEVSPLVGVNLPLEQTYIGASYQYSMRYFFDRDDHKADHTHIANILLNHSFSDRLKLKVKDSFVDAQEPELLDPDVKSLLLRSNGNNFHNNGSIDLSADLTRQFAVSFGYANSYYDYQQDGPGSYSATLDRMEHLGHVDFRWHAMPDTDLLVGYQYGQVNYQSKDNLAAVGPYVDPKVRNNRSHFAYLGADHSFNSQLSLSIRGGAQFREYTDAPSGSQNDSTSPYIDANLSYTYMEGSTVQFGVRHAKNQTDVAFGALGDATSSVVLDTDTTTFYAALTHRITAKLSANVVSQVQLSTFNGGSVDGKREDLYLIGLNLGYQINQFLGCELGYNYDRVDSDINVGGISRGFSRNRVYIGLRASY